MASPGSMGAYKEMTDLFKEQELCESRNREFAEYFDQYVAANKIKYTGPCIPKNCGRRVNHENNTEYVFESHIDELDDLTLTDFGARYYNATPELLNTWTKRDCGEDNFIKVARQHDTYGKMIHTIRLIRVYTSRTGVTEKL